MLRVMQWHSALPPPASRKQMHLTSHIQHDKAQSALPHGSEAVTVPSRVSHRSPPNTEVRCGWKGGKEDAASSDGSIVSPVLHYSEPTSKNGPQLRLRAVGSPMQCCLPQGNGRSLWDQDRRNSLGERLTSQSSVTRQALWWDRVPQPTQGTYKCKFSSVPAL